MLVDTGFIGALKPQDAAEPVRRRQRDKNRTRKVDHTQESEVVRNQTEQEEKPSAGLSRYV